MSERKNQFRFRLSVTDRRCGEEIRRNIIAPDPDEAMYQMKLLFIRETSTEEELFDRHFVVRIIKTLPLNSKDRIDDDEAEA